MISREQKVWLAALLLLDLAISIGFLIMLPSRVPTHWNWRGEIDRYGSSLETTLVLSICVMFLPLIMMALPKLGAVGRALERSRAVYGRVVVAITAALVAIHVIVMLSASAKSDAPVAGVPIVFGVLWIVVGNWMGKIRRNWLMGIRTRWTLKNDAVWERTHRVGGRLFVANGFVTLLAGIFLPAVAGFVVLIGGLLALTLWAFAYSWWITPRPSAG